MWELHLHMETLNAVAVMSMITVAGEKAAAVWLCASNCEPVELFYSKADQGVTLITIVSIDWCCPPKRRTSPVIPRDGLKLGLSESKHTLSHRTAVSCCESTWDGHLNQIQTQHDVISGYINHCKCIAWPLIPFCWQATL